MLLKLGKEQAAAVSYPLKYMDLANEIRLPRIKYKRGAKLTKNPYKIKKIPIVDESKRPKRVLDGYAITDEARCEYPNDVIRIKLAKKNFVETKVEDLGWFIYLSELDVSENYLALEDFVYLTGLQTLNMSANHIKEVRMNELHAYKTLDTLNLSFNALTSPAIRSLAAIPNLKKLSLESNDLKELPETMADFQNLEELNLSGNIFESNASASNLWFTLASIKKLKFLDLSRNILRGIHTERLVSGNFMNLLVLDFSYNAVENQHNLICARNFRNLKKLIITGNPFSIKAEHKGLEMEVYARTGGLVVNDDIEKHYLKPKNDKNRLKIKFDNIKKIYPDDFQKYKENYFLGVQMPTEGDQQAEEQDVVHQPQQTFQEQAEEEEDDAQQENNDEEQPAFMTEDPNQPQQVRKAQKNNSNLKNSQESLIKQGSSASYPAHISQQSATLSKGSLGRQNNNTQSMNYNEFIDAAREQLGDSKEYDQHYDLNTAYKALKNMIKRPDTFDFKDNQEPNYLKPTSTIQRYKFKENSAMLVTAEQVEQYEQRQIEQKEKLLRQQQQKAKANASNENQSGQALKKKNSSDDVVTDIARLF